MPFEIDYGKENSKSLSLTVHVYSVFKAISLIQKNKEKDGTDGEVEININQIISESSHLVTIYFTDVCS